MDEPIISRARIQTMGKAAALAGKARDSHHIKESAPARHDWLLGYDSVSQQSHIAPAGRARIEQAQGEAA